MNWFNGSDWQCRAVRAIYVSHGMRYHLDSCLGLDGRATRFYLRRGGPLLPTDLPTYKPDMIPSPSSIPLSHTRSLLFSSLIISSYLLEIPFPERTSTTCEPLHEETDTKTTTHHYHLAFAQITLASDPIFFLFFYPLFLHLSLSFLFFGFCVHHYPHPTIPALSSSRPTTYHEGRKKGSGAYVYFVYCRFDSIRLFLFRSFFLSFALYCIIGTLEFRTDKPKFKKSN